MVIVFMWCYVILVECVWWGGMWVDCIFEFVFVC